MSVPIPPSYVLVRICRLNNYDYNSSYDNQYDAKQFDGDKEIAQSSTRFGTDGIRDAHDHKDDDGEHFVFNPSSLIGYTCSRVDGLDEDDTQNR